MESVLLIVLLVATLVFFIYGSIRDYKNHTLMEAPMFLLTIGWLLGAFFIKKLPWDYMLFITGFILITYLVFNLIFKPWERFNTDILAVLIALSSYISGGNFYIIFPIVIIGLFFSFVIALIIDHGRFRFIPSGKIALCPGALFPIGAMSVKAIISILSIVLIFSFTPTVHAAEVAERHYSFIPNTYYETERGSGSDLLITIKERDELPISTSSINQVRFAAAVIDPSFYTLTQKSDHEISLNISHDYIYDYAEGGIFSLDLSFNDGFYAVCFVTVKDPNPAPKERLSAVYIGQTKDNLNNLNITVSKLSSYFGPGFVTVYSKDNPSKSISFDVSFDKSPTDLNRIYSINIKDTPFSVGEVIYAKATSKGRDSISSGKISEDYSIRGEAPEATSQSQATNPNLQTQQSQTPQNTTENNPGTNESMERNPAPSGGTISQNIQETVPNLATTEEETTDFPTLERVIPENISENNTPEASGTHATLASMFKSLPLIAKVAIILIPILIAAFIIFYFFIYKARKDRDNGIIKDSDEIIKDDRG